MDSAIAPTEQRSAARVLVAVGLIGGALYSALGTWSEGRAFGGVDGDGGWIDESGAPVSTPPLEAQVTGHPAPWVLLLLAVVLIGGHLWASRSATRAVARRRYGVTVLTAIVLVLAALIVFTGLQMWLVEQAFDAGSAHPVLLGGADLVVGPMPRG